MARNGGAKIVSHQRRQLVWIIQPAAAAWATIPEPACATASAAPTITENLFVVGAPHAAQRRMYERYVTFVALTRALGGGDCEATGPFSYANHGSCP